MGQFVLIVMVHVAIMGGESESWSKHWHVYDNETECKYAALNLTFNKNSGNQTDLISVNSEAVCEKFDPKKHGNFYRGVK